MLYLKCRHGCRNRELIVNWIIHLLAAAELLARFPFSALSFTFYVFNYSTTESNRLHFLNRQSIKKKSITLLSHHLVALWWEDLVVTRRPQVWIPPWQSLLSREGSTASPPDDLHGYKVTWTEANPVFRSYSFQRSIIRHLDSRWRGLSFSTLVTFTDRKIKHFRLSSDSEVENST